MNYQFLCNILQYGIISNLYFINRFNILLGYIRIIVLLNEITY